MPFVDEPTTSSILVPLRKGESPALICSLARRAAIDSPAPGIDTDPSLELWEAGKWSSLAAVDSLSPCAGEMARPSLLPFLCASISNRKRRADSGADRSRALVRPFFPFSEALFVADRADAGTPGSETALSLVLLIGFEPAELLDSLSVPGRS